MIDLCARAACSETACLPAVPVCPPEAAPNQPTDLVLPPTLGAARRRLEQLLDQAHGATLLVCIEDWEDVDRRWRNWQPALREILLAVRHAEEREPHLGQRQLASGVSLAAHLEALGPLVCHLEVTLLECQDHWSWPEALMFSEILENRLIPWLETLSQGLDALDEDVAS